MSKHQNPDDKSASAKLLLGDHDSTDLLGKIVDSVADPIFVKDEDHRWIMLNQAVCDLLGHSRETLLGKSDFDFFPAEEAEVFWEKDEEVFASGGTNINEEQLTSRDGLTRTIMTKKSVFTDPSGKKLLVGVIRDITELKQAERAMHQTRTELEEKVELRTAEVRKTQEMLLHAQKMDAIGQLAGGVAHDFNNLLSILQGSLELITLRTSGDDELAELTEQALAALSRGTSLTQRMLSFSGQQTSRPKATNVVGLIKGVEHLLRRSLSADYTITFSYESEYLAAEVDPAQLETAFINLALNARDSMPKGGPLVVQVASECISKERAASSRMLSPGQAVSIRVTDEGCGIDSAHIGDVFKPFFTTKPAGQGTGLGLSMVHGFAQQANGAIEVSSTINHGTTFCLYLPQLTSLQLVGDDGSLRPHAKPIGTGRTILVVEDETAVRTMTSMFLQTLGFTVHGAGNAKDAREAVKRIGTIDVLLTDLILGDGDNGIELMQTMRAAHPELRHIFMTGYADERKPEALETGDAPLLTKPFRLASLETALTKALSQ